MRVLLRMTAVAVMACAGRAQSFTAGIKGGLPVTSFFETGSTSSVTYTSSTHRYTLGPTVELKIPFGFSVEVDALYHRIDFDTASPGITTAAAGNAWDIPVLLKHHIGSAPLMHPFVDGGLQERYVGGFSKVVTALSGTPGALTSLVTKGGPVPEFNKNFYPGIVLGGGFDVHVPFVHVAPELRYTHWLAGTHDIVHFTPNQVELLVGITF